MTTMISEVYDAFKAAGVADEQAKAAAKAVLPAEQAATRADMQALKADIEQLRFEMNGEMYRVVGAQTIILVGVMVALKLFV